MDKFQPFNLFSFFLQVRIRTYNGLAFVSTVEIIHVEYLQATPLFSKTTYKVPVTEDAEVGTSLFQVVANSASSIAQVVYSVIDGRSNNASIWYSNKGGNFQPTWPI